MSIITDPIAAQKLTAARAQLLINKGQGFFGTLALRLRLVERTDIKTLAVDGKHMFYNPTFVREELTDSLTRSAVAHEVMHCALDHMTRLNGRNPKKWNHAGDYAINLILEEAGFEIGKNWLLNKKYAGMSADEIYNMLPDPPDGGEAPGPGEPGGALDEVLPGISSESESNAVDWKIATIQAAQMAKQAGNMPGALKRFIEDSAKPKVDWRDQLRHFITQISKDDYSWARPNRRYLAAGLYMPSLYDESMGDIVVGIDTSGSIDQKTLNAFGAEIKAIAAAVRPANIHVVYCDSEVNHVDRFGQHDELKFEMHGGGGTAFKPVFDYVEQEGLRPEALVYLTDLYGDYTFAAPEYPTLWVCTTDQKAAFGSTIHIEV